MKGKPKQHANMLRKLGGRGSWDNAVKIAMQEKNSNQVKNDNQYPSLKKESYFSLKIKTESKSHTRKTKEW